MFDGINQRAEGRRAYLTRFDLPADAAGFASQYRVRTMAFHFWGQHCEMCSAPECYRTCELYERGADWRCQTFIYGIGKHRGLRTLHPYGMECAFKGHAHLFTHLTLPQVNAARLRRLEAIHERAVEPVLRALDWPLRAFGLPPLFQKASVAGLARELYRRGRARPASLPDGFLLQIYNPNRDEIDLTITIRNDPALPRTPMFRETVRLAPGFNECLFPIERISGSVNLGAPKTVSLFPPGQREAFLVVLAADLVGLEPEPSPASSRKPVKCVVFDLDRTLWDGILLEGRPGLRLRPNVEFLLAELDRRGILLSVASKNQPADALAALRDRHIDHYFLHPQIGWGPKSEGLRRIAARLNIGIDTLAFVDDSEFERAEVAAHLLEVLVLPETALSLLHRHPLMQGSSSEEAPLRRLYYRDEAKRQEFQEASGLDYEAFLRSCEIVVVMSQPAAADIDRLHELVQRTNQLNFSGTRYGREDLAAILADPGRDVFVMRVRDRFGDYGLVGLAVIVRHPERPRLIDLALSCRVQGRQVEHGVLATLADHYRAGGAHALDVVYRRTARNAPAGQVFDDLGFTLDREEGERRELSFALARPLAPPAHLAVEWAAADAVASAT